ncbi:type IV pilin protein [Massilia yuzhufengensis]|uniref:Type IV pilus assembly protein PilE n=1 Tax=Massilia yuzhufengensis TaxID=1164594 RepID=A0A1I1JEL4_9BURK|nr:type IV pilin protein [Massilia yuzhufengensis]SFC46432.1 type IV pilus assembly protein PilE [Massilia yuzhufengensis]
MIKRQAGFTLIEIMITVVVIGILTAVALPSYNGYMMRARLTEAFTGLAGLQPRMEQHWSNTRSYAGFDAAALKLMPKDSDNFAYELTESSASAYLVTATGQGTADGFVFTIDQNGRRATTGVPDGWTGSDDCWVDRKEGTCTQ